MHDELSLNEVQKEWHGTLKAYLIGFTACLILTIFSFSTVFYNLFPVQTQIYVVLGLAVIQIIVQLGFFLHLGQEAAPRWESVVFALMIVILLIIVIGTLWVMNDLNERTMTM